MNWWTIFITGLTTGGLSCLAMQGGLLASAIANQKDEELEEVSKKSWSKKKRKQLTNTNPKSFDQLDWLPVAMFLIGKIISHTLFGFFLGFLGSKLELSLTARLVFQSAAALFMFATAMNLLEIHPIFRYVVIQPPKFFTKMVRNSTKSKALFTPLMIGFLTLLIPCGVTQSMEVLAMTSASPIIGALTMFLFVLGTTPLFVILGVGVAKFSEFWSTSFLKIAAYSLIYLAATSINGVLVVTDSPVTIGKVARAIFDPAGVMGSDSVSLTQENAGVQKINVNVVNAGYQPSKLKVKAGVPVQMTLTTKDAYTCASDFVFPAFDLRARLAPNDTQTLSFTPTKTGKYTFSCSMGMYTGTLEVI